MPSAHTPSHLRLQSSFDPVAVESTRSHFVSSPPQKKQKMSLTQTYYIAASARSKLGREASRADHDLRLLVGHANLLDSLMLELADAEREQEAWFNQTVKKASKADEPRHVQWVDTIAEAPEDEEEDSDSDSESDYYDEDGDFDMMLPMPRRIMQAPVQVTTTEMDEDEDFYEDFEDDEEHALTRTSSQSPPELVHDEDSDDESPPVSPPTLSMEFSEKEAILTTSYYDRKPSALSTPEQASFIQDGFFIPERNNAPLIATC
ncbi:hypothetical protein BU16DRAFT_522429 [Lophium mytilinum]|uniref:Uncharacterized protein n=1 Tax=Lophium mytilinum TaxID=390894 RepID=A0A6A6R9P6_9PEZI|nr:hypothetical protein BU16DRAFT_522429 [Lophium mytilinum]